MNVGETKNSSEKRLTNLGGYAIMQRLKEMSRNNKNARSTALQESEDFS
jgi:hypothetical protein